MFDDFRKILDEIQRLTPQEQSAAKTAFVAWCIAQCVYYIVAGVVAWALGRRLIQACLAAWREARRPGE
jgi:hypothetical protein